MARMAAAARESPRTFLPRPWQRVPAVLAALGITREAPPPPVVYSPPLVGYVAGLGALGLLLAAAMVRAPAAVGGFVAMAIAALSLVSTSARLIPGGRTLSSAPALA